MTSSRQRPKHQALQPAKKLPSGRNIWIITHALFGPWRSVWGPSTYFQSWAGTFHPASISPAVPAGRASELLYHWFSCNDAWAKINRWHPCLGVCNYLVLGVSENCKDLWKAGLCVCFSHVCYAFHSRAPEFIEAQGSTRRCRSYSCWFMNKWPGGRGCSS